MEESLNDVPVNRTFFELYVVLSRLSDVITIMCCGKTPNLSHLLQKDHLGPDMLRSAKYQ
ncbi:hypothetical protein [Comamonas sp. NoAH]|uniref:hypothetical protein n=1 Tax=Comamonas halotolerans TaxID=3041496 RepID=UPI0024E18191|nr:hypothetical protein [Comamonas sp. NoAH]